MSDEQTLSRITVSNLRNLSVDSLPIHGSANIITGRNGQGKTSLLEAIYFLATTKSFRTPRPSNLITFGKSGVFVGGQVISGGLVRSQSAALETGENPRRLLLANEQPVTISEYLRLLPVVSYSASRLDVLRGGPEERRQFIDRGAAAVNPLYLSTLRRYARVLKQRNALLHDLARSDRPKSTLASWDTEFMEAADALIDGRRAYLQVLLEEWWPLLSEYPFLPDGTEITYLPSHPNVNQSSREIRAGFSLSGPHRDDVSITSRHHPVHEVLSGGQQKVLLLTLKIAKLKTAKRMNGVSPMFLLDDIDAELDEHVIEELLSSLPFYGQIFVSSAKRAVIERIRKHPHQMLVLDNGRVKHVD